MFVGSSEMYAILMKIGVTTFHTTKQNQPLLTSKKQDSKGTNKEMLLLLIFIDGEVVVMKSLN